LQKNTLCKSSRFSGVSEVHCIKINKYGPVICTNDHVVLCVQLPALAQNRMTKKKPSPQNRIWEKERRERLNKTFEDLHRLLPDHEPSSALTKVEILQQTIEFIGKLQKKIKDLMRECNDPLKDQLHEQEQRLKRLLGRNEELVDLLRKAKIAVPPCKYTIPEEERQQRGEEKENGNREKKSEAKRRRPSAAAKKQSVINQKHPVSHSGSTVGSDALALSGVNSVLMTTNAPAIVVSNSGAGGVQSAPSSLALKHINGLSIGPGNGVNVTPALLSTPIMTTSVLISNNGNLMQMPLVAPPSSLLIVGSEDVRAKLNLKHRPHGGGKGKSKRGKFVIKSIDVIPGRIVDGKIPIQPLRRNTNELSLKGSKMSKLKRKKSVDKGKQSRKVTVDATRGEKASDENGPTENKRAKRTEGPSASAVEVQSKDNQLPQSPRKETEVAIGTDQSASSLLPAADKTMRKEYEKANQPNPGDDPQGGHLGQINLNHPDLSDDIFANLQVPGDSNAHGSHDDDGSLSPTAAYLMNFPLVAGGGKAAGNHIEAGDGDECDEGVTVAELQTVKKDSASVTVLATTGAGTEASGNMMLDNFSSFFNYGQMETIGAGSAPSVGQEGAILHSLPVASTSNVPTVTTVAAPPSTRENGFSCYTSTYQSIDNMLEHRPAVPNRTTIGTPAKIPTTSSESDYAASVAFTFTLTSGTSTAPTTSQPGATMATTHFYGSTCAALTTNPVVKPVVDDFNSPLKPSIEFTFSLTSTTGSQARTVQSQYTNSAILATTMTTPSYDTYGYYHKTVPQTANYCPSFGVLDPLLTTEKPATSFTFCLTSSTKTEPSYTQSSLATVATHTSQVYETAPKFSTKHPQQGTSECYPLKHAAPKAEKASQRSHGSGGHVYSLGTDGHTNGMHQQTSIQSQQQTTATASSSSASQQNSQSRYDVSWMAAGTHNEPATSATIHHSQQQQQQQQQQHQHQHQQQQHSQPYELAPAQIISSLEFPVPSAGYSASYKSDIFFAHPPGEENNLTWSSPSKLSNILNDSSSPYFPPVTLPSLNGDLALNTSIGTGTGASSGSYKAGATSTAKKGQLQGGVGGVGQSSEGTPGSSFLSVSQLVNQPTKPSYHGHGATNCQQKPPNNNYSAEALIGNNSYNPNAVSLGSAGHDTVRKDKLFDYGIMDGGFSSSSVPSSAALTFNFDTYGAPPGADFNKGYNFAPTQQSGYVPPYATDGGGYGSGVPGGCTGSSAGASGSTGLPYYGKTPSQGYCYQQASVSSSSATTYPSHVTLPQATQGGA
uniref:Uncharacterized protein n=1 Tax=Anopheles atroparvus TaxID=41427 RepID=A0A182JF35_ANOAO